MKLLYREFPSVDYSQYHFPYCIYAIRESGDSYHELYRQGFLPYSNDLDEVQEIYYLARSVRMNLGEHRFHFKQNNVLNKFKSAYADEGLQFILRPKSGLLHDEKFHDWCLCNARNHFLSAERLHYILSRPYLTDILEISHQGRLLAYLLPVHENRHFVHVWFSFYDLRQQQGDFGKWILLKTINWYQQQGISWFYIGTCYAQGALYKLTLSNATQYFDGASWRDDVSLLKKKLLSEDQAV